MTAFQETRRSRWQYKSHLLCAKPAIITKQAAIFISMTSSANTQERSSSPNNPGRRLGLRHRLTLREKLRKKGLISSFRTLLRFAADRARENDLTEVTSTMALATLTAIVPVLALSLAAFSAFPSFAGARQALEDLIVMSLLPEQYSEQLLGYISQFTSHAAGLTTFGLLGLAVTAFLLIDKLFVTLNRIFKVTAPRPWFQRVLIYWALMTVGPLAVAVSLTMTGHYAAMALEGIDPGVSKTLYNVGQVFLQAFGFAVIYKFVPACRVHFSHALVGGSVVSVCGLVVKQLFGMWVTAGTLTNIYGAFVAIPVFVLWVYVAWYLFFAGAAIAATIPKLTAGRFLDYYRPGNEFLTALAMLRELVHLRLRQKPPILDVEELCDAADTYPEAAERILSRLAEAGYVAPVTTEAGGRTQEWVLVADSQKTTLLRAFEFFAVSGGNSLVSSKMQRLAGKDGAVGILADWWKQFSTNEALNRPMAQLFALPGEEEESVSDGSLRNNSSRIQKS
jgi:yihY family protein